MKSSGFPRWLSGLKKKKKNPPVNAGDVVSIPGSERSGEGNGNPLPYSCLGNPMDRENTGGL